MPLSNRLARLIREGHPALGMWINLADPGVAQIAALAGYDWVMIDTEHNPFTVDMVIGLFMDFF
jgi:4-hydroxy-2-oxoheptanedioate aldolase